MPRKRYDDEELRRRALELRKRGYSYREIAKELGCSVYKVHEVLAPIENPRSRLRQVAELATRVDELKTRVDELAGRINELFEKLSLVEARLSRYGQLDDLVKGFEKLREDVAAVRRELDAKYGVVSGALVDLGSEISRLLSDVELIRASASMRTRHHPCSYMDAEGYCTALYWRERIEGLDMKQELYEGRPIYLLNVKKHPLLCCACPLYTPRRR